MGRPLVVNRAMAKFAVSNVYMLLGDFAGMHIRDVRVLYMIRDELTQAEEGQVRIRYGLRGDSKFVKTKNQANLVGAFRKT